MSRKIHADIFIDHNFGDLPDWGEIYQTVLNDVPKLPKKKKSWFGL